MLVHRFAEPVALSSTESADLPLAGCAARLGFDLLALRARRKQQPKRSALRVQEGGRTKSAQFAACPFGMSQLDRTLIIANCA